MKSKLILIIGGAKSGKTVLAEKTAGVFKKVLYYGTAQPHSEELTARIAKLKAARPAAWMSVDYPMSFDQLLQFVNSERMECLVFDSIALWLGGELTAAGSKYSKAQLMYHVERQVAHLLQMLTSFPIPVVVVSNDVSRGVVPEHESGRFFRDTLAKINLDLAAAADLVCDCNVGQALLIKDAARAVANHGNYPLSVATPEYLGKSLKADDVKPLRIVS